MEKIFFAKIEAWIVFLIIIVFTLGAILFAYVAQERAKGSGIGGEFGQLLLELAESPKLIGTAFEELGESRGGRVRDLDPDIGSSINSFQGLDTVPGYLGTRSDTEGGKIFELKQIATGKTILSWPYSSGNIPAAVSFVDNTLIVKDIGGFEDTTDYLRKIDPSGRELWSRKIPAHHSVHVDSKGYIYTPVIMPEHTNTRFLENYRDDGYAILSPQGELMGQGSVSDILAGNALGHLVLGVGPVEPDAIHLNAVKPAETTTQYWNEGDLLMSSRHLSLVFLYRPATGKVIWHKSGPWLNQHDPDFLGSDRISVFGNDVVSTYGNRTSKDVPFLDRGNDIYIYDFKNDAVSTPYSEIMQRSGLSTVTGGSHTILSDGSLFAYFTNAGVGFIHNPGKSSLHYFGVIAGPGKISIGAAPTVYETD